MRKLLAIVLACLLLGSIALLFLFFRKVVQGTLEFEIAKSLLQLGVVAVVGAMVSVLVFEYQRERQAVDKTIDLERQATDKQRDIERKALEYRESLLLSVLSRTMDAYDRAKKSRRLLRGRAIVNRDEIGVVLATQYDECFELINGAQLDLENLARDVETSSKAFSDPATLVKHLRAMESYLRSLIGEYELHRRSFSGAEGSFPLSQLSLLEDFIRSAKASSFMPTMVMPYHDVQKIIRGDLLHPNLPESIATLNPPSQRTASGDR